MSEEEKPEEQTQLTQYQKIDRDLNSDRFQLAIANALPDTGVNAEKFVRFALTAINKNPKLGLCTRTSVAQCLLDCASYGIEPDGRRAHLIPYENSIKNEVGQWIKVLTCTLQLDYKGIVELVRRGGTVSNIVANVVYDNDEFDFIEGTDSFLRHKRLLKDRGDLMCVYSFISFKDGSDSFEIMTIEEVNAVRDKSQGYIAACKNAEKYNKANNHPWHVWWEAMARKTVFKKHSKWLTLSPEVHEAIVRDEKQEHLSPADRAKIAKPIIPSDPTDIFTEMGEQENGGGEHSDAEAVVVEVVDEGGGEKVEKSEPKDDPKKKTDKGKYCEEFRSQLEMLDIKELDFLKWCQENKHLNWKKEEVPTLEALSVPKLKELEPDLMTIAEQIQAK